MQTRSPLDKAYRLISILILILGAQLGITGLGMVKIGSVGKIRYEAASGRMLRSFSAQDQKYFSYARKIRNTGWLCIMAGSLVCGAGVSLLWIPGLIPLFLLREKEQSVTFRQTAAPSE